MSEVFTTDIAGAMPLDQRYRRLWSAQRTSRWNIENRQDLEKKLAVWERFYNYDRPHGAHGGKTPYEALREKLR